ncbi:MAG: hypothetical protein PHQ23_13685 [Candidatus Wallbacteria bacterium]|nr:hypothetical protein [Candidatus Wallbacteria bacterium]
MTTEIETTVCTEDTGIFPQTCAKFSNESCESCGRFLGPDRQSCIYCGALRAYRIPVRKFRAFGFALIAVGFIYFFLAFSYKPVFTPLTDLDESKNFQRVRVKAYVAGVYTNKDKYQKDTSVNMTLRGLKPDGSPDPGKGGMNEIRLRAEGGVGTDLIKNGNLPKIGDQVECSASLYAGPGYRLLSLSSYNFLKISGHAGLSAVTTFHPVTVSGLLADPDSWRNKTVTVKKARIVKCYARYNIDISDPDADPSQKLLVFGVQPDQHKEDELVSVRGTFVYYADGNCWEIKTAKEDSEALIRLGEE